MRKRETIWLVGILLAVTLPLPAMAETIGDPSAFVTGHLTVGANLYNTSGKWAIYTNGRLLCKDAGTNQLWISHDGFHFDRAGAAYVDNHRVGASTYFRVSNAANRDTLAMTIQPNGNITVQNGDLDVNGEGTVDVLNIQGGSDLSEQFDVSSPQEVEPGMVVSIDPVNAGKLMVSGSAYDNKVAGIVSGAGGLKTGVTMGQVDSIAHGSCPIALTGRVFCMVDATEAAVAPGDLLTTSDTPGHAMKVQDYDKAKGATIGKAMTPLAQGEKGLVLVLVSLQ